MPTINVKYKRKGILISLSGKLNLLKVNTNIIEYASPTMGLIKIAKLLSSSKILFGISEYPMSVKMLNTNRESPKASMLRDLTFFCKS